MGMKKNVSPANDTRQMVEYEASAESRRIFGAVYTPQSIALWLAQHVEHLGFTPKLVLDPAAGDGVLLKAAQEVFPNCRAIAFEIDPEAHLRLKKYWPQRNSGAKDSLMISRWLPRGSEDVLIFSNPPWGAKISAEANLRYRDKFESAKGFYDLYDLFLEKSFQELPEGSWGAFFLPDSILLKQHKDIRKLLVENAQIKSVTRLPEGVFNGVAMGSIAIVFRKIRPKWNSRMLISRINRTNYKQFKTHSVYLAREIKQNSRFINQSDWRSDPSFSWSMELEGAGSFIKQLNVFKGIPNCESTWDEWFESGRGLEIGKKAPFLLSQSGNSINSQQRVVAVGEDVNRLSIKPTRTINLNLPRFNFKSELNDQPRILVRKTGIGLKAVVASGVVTTQTIYHFIPKKNAPEYALHYAAGFLISRVIIALHLAKTGEIEWRSHPYVTQRTIRELNLPIPKAGTRDEKVAIEIASLSKIMHEKGTSPLLEEKLDQLVCQIIGGESGLQNWAYKFLFNVKGCSYTKMLVADINLDSQVA
jgi:predicted RNA methylase